MCTFRSRAARRLATSPLVRPAIRAAGKLGRVLLRWQEPVIEFARRVEAAANGESALATEPAAFVDRGSGHGRLLLVVAGHKPLLWPYVLPRLRRYSDDLDVDACVVCPGVTDEAYATLSDFCEEYSWSILRTTVNQLCLAQNLAIAHFTDAEYVFKVDEDMFVTRMWMPLLEECLARVEREMHYQVGFVAPLIPVNGYGYRVFLELFDLLEEYCDRFPGLPPISACMGVGAHHEGAVAEWLWRRSSPLDEVAEKLRNSPPAYSICPHRFSIGAILFRRQLWKELGGFVVAPEGQLGHEETQLCNYCMDQSRAIIVSHNCLCGHFSFFPQYQHMLKLLLNEPWLFQ